MQSCGVNCHPSYSRKFPYVSSCVALEEILRSEEYGVFQDTLENQKVLQQHGHSDIHISEIKSYPNDAFLILNRMILDVDSNCVHPMFQFRVYMCAQVHISDIIWEIMR